MSVTVNDILSLDLLKDAKLAAGKGGLHREVLRVNFTDSPLEITDPGYTLVQRGDLYILSFYSQSGNEKDIYDLINFYIQTGSACCIAVDSYIKDFPPSVKQLANKNNYPLLMMSNEIPYASLIQKITSLMMTEQLDMYSEVKLHCLLHENLSVEEQQDILSYLVPVCPQRFVCVYLRFSAGSQHIFRQIKRSISSQFNLSFLNYRNGGFLVVDVSVHKRLDVILQNLPPIFSSYTEAYIVGISSPAESAQRLSLAFQEAIDASLVGEITHSTITYYETIPLYHLLLPLKSHRALEEYCHRILGPLREYELHYNVELIQTIAVYLELNGNIAKTAKKMNAHVNTIRFRIHKAQSLLGLEKEPYAFIEQLSIALKGKLLLTKNPG